VNAGEARGLSLRFRYCSVWLREGHVRGHPEALRHRNCQSKNPRSGFSAVERHCQSGLSFFEGALLRQWALDCQNRTVNTTWRRSRAARWKKSATS
jgi:hypothetical protein